MERKEVLKSMVDANFQTMSSVLMFQAWIFCSLNWIFPSAVKDHFLVFTAVIYLFWIEFSHNSAVEPIDCQERKQIGWANKENFSVSVAGPLGP